MKYHWGWGVGLFNSFKSNMTILCPTFFCKAEILLRCRSYKGFVTEANLLMKPRCELTRPRNDLNSITVEGRLTFLLLCTYFVPSFQPDWVRRSPKNVISHWQTLYFDDSNVAFTSSSLLSSSLMSNMWSSLLPKEKTKTSSQYTMTPVKEKSEMTLFIDDCRSCIAIFDSIGMTQWW